MTSKKWLILGAIAIASLLLAATAVARPAAQSPQAGDASQKLVADGPAGSLTVAAASPVSTSFTYQGQLRDDGEPVSDICNMQFRLYDQAEDGVQVGAVITASVPISEGLFTVSLDFGSAVFAGDARWLEIAIQCPGDATPVSLNPRQPLSAAPYALYSRAAPWDGIADMPAGFADGEDAVDDADADPGNELEMPDSCANGQIAKWDGSTWACGDDDGTAYSAGTGLVLTGTVLSANPAEVQWRVGDACGSGYAIQEINQDGSVTCTPLLQERVLGTCAAGSSIRVIHADGTVTCESDDVGAGGGSWSLSGNAGTSPGTDFLGTTDGVSLTLVVSGTTALRLQPNDISPNLVGGYGGNSVSPGVAGATIGGGGRSGEINQVSGDYATIGGGYHNSAHYTGTTVAGGQYNTASGENATVGGGEHNEASGYATSVAGGSWITATGEYAAVGGGWGNIVSNWFATVGGGEGNTASGHTAAVGGGRYNTASNHYAIVGGGTDNTASGVHTTVGGGQWNEANTDYATVGGGEENTASGWSATIGGGHSNIASHHYATVGGGTDNTASGENATVGGGWGNTATYTNATTSGGEYNAASGYAATIPGGQYNIAAGDYSFAAGRRAQANNDGCFVWGDSTDADVACNNDDRWVTRASGGVYFFTSGDQSTGVHLPSGGETWQQVSASDRNLKENFALVDEQQILDLLADIPITTWTYKASESGARHISPMAQDFYAAFAVGEDDKHLSALDVNGVALAAIQGLYAQNQELEQQNADLEARVAALEAALANGAAPAQGSQLNLVPWTSLLLTGVGLTWVLRRRNDLHGLFNGGGR